MDPTEVFGAATQLLIVLFAISLHEAAHAWAAARLGDPTARDLGRTSLNPVAHVDPVGSLLIPILLLIGGLPVFGWGRETPLDASKLGRPQRDQILVHLAGPLANAAVFVFTTLVLVLTIHRFPEGHEAAKLTLQRRMPETEVAHFPVMFTLVKMAYLNALLAAISLIPLPPLDGGQILLQVMPPDWAAKYATVRPFGLTILLGLALLQFLALLVLPISIFLLLVIGR